jgi:RNA polymerase sigma factor (sigma-70 family)
MHPSSPPTSIVLAAKRGEPLAIAELLRLYSPDVRRFAMRHCLVSQVDDAVQETLLVLARRLHQLEKAAALTAWLFRVVQRKCRRLARDAFGFDPYEEGKIEGWVGQRATPDLHWDVAHALESLPQRYREVVLLRDVEGMTVAEIARELSLSTAATKSLIHRARELTREYLLA